MEILAIRISRDDQPDLSMSLLVLHGLPISTDLECRNLHGVWIIRLLEGWYRSGERRGEEISAFNSSSIMKF
jgi:hypothetical protein